VPENATSPRVALIDRLDDPERDWLEGEIWELAGALREWGAWTRVVRFQAGHLGVLTLFRDGAPGDRVGFHPDMPPESAPMRASFVEYITRIVARHEITALRAFDDRLLPLLEAARRQLPFHLLGSADAPGANVADAACQLIEACRISNTDH